MAKLYMQFDLKVLILENNTYTHKRIHARERERERVTIVIVIFYIYTHIFLTLFSNNLNYIKLFY